MVLSPGPIASSPSDIALAVAPRERCGFPRHLFPPHRHSHTQTHTHAFSQLLADVVEMNCLEKNSQLPRSHSGCPAVGNFCGSPISGAFVPSTREISGMAKKLLKWGGFFPGVASFWGNLLSAGVQQAVRGSLVGFVFASHKLEELFRGDPLSS